MECLKCRTQKEVWRQSCRLKAVKIPVQCSKWSSCHIHPKETCIIKILINSSYLNRLYYYVHQYLYWCETIYWNRLSLWGAPSLKKTDSPQPPSTANRVPQSKCGVSWAPLPFILRFWILQSCEDLVHAVTTTMSSCVWWCWRVWKIRFRWRYPLPLFLTILPPSPLR